MVDVFILIVATPHGYLLVKLHAYGVCVCGGGGGRGRAGGVTAYTLNCRCIVKFCPTDEISTCTCIFDDAKIL